MHKQLTQIWRWFGRKRVLLFVLVFSLLLLGATIYRFWAQSNWMQDDFAKQIQSIELKNSFAQLSLYIKEAESANRGYAISGDNKFDKEFKNTLDSINTAYRLLQQLQRRKESVVDATMFLKSDSLMLQKIAWMRRINTLCNVGNRSEALAAITTSKGLGLADSITRINTKISENLQAQIQHAQIGYLNADNRNDQLAYSGIIASMLLIVTVFYFLIKEIRRTERVSEELRERKEHLKITLNSISEGIITTNRLGKILYMNPPAERLTGWSWREAKNQPLQKVYDVVNEETATPFEDIVSRILKDGKKIEFENNTILKAKNSQSFIISNNGSPLLDAKGNISGAVLVFNDITEKKKIEDKLKQSEKQYRDLIQNLPEAVYTCNSQGYVQLYNQSAVRLWGREPIIGTDQWCGSWKIVDRDGTTLPHDKCPMAVSIKERKVPDDEKIIVQRPDGSLRNVLNYPTLVINADGQLTGGVNMLIDVTDKIEKEVLIKQSEKKYSALVEQAADGIFLIGRQGNFLSANTSGCRMLGYDKVSMMKINLKDIIPAISHDKIAINLNDLGNGYPLLAERKLRRQNGTVFYTEVNAQMTNDGNFLAIVRDIADRKNAEKKMKKAIERYDILSKATSDTIWDWDIATHQIIYNDGITQMFGYQLSKVDNLIDWWKMNIHPDDLQTVSESLEDTFTNKTQSIQLQYRFRCADETFKYIYDRAFIIYDEHQQPMRMIGAMQDITYAKEEEVRIVKAILEAQEKERNVIGAELHDNINQLLAVSLLTLGMVKEKKSDMEAAAEYLETTKEYILDAIDEVRKLSHQLAPATTGDDSLKDIFEELLESINMDGRYQITLHFGEINGSAMSEGIQINLFRILQEQIKNILKYSEATAIEVAVALIDNTIKLRIFDNGKGFDIKATKKGIGLSNLKKRAESFSGKFILNSAIGKGCEIIVEIPLAL